MSNPVSGSAKPSASCHSVACQRGKILVVDDDPDFAEYTRIVLESQGYTVRTAATVDLALSLMRQDKPDVALLDVMMSYVLDGINLTHQMCADSALRDIPVIMISAIVSREEAGAFPIDECFSVKTFMTKPVDPGELLQQVAKLLPHRADDENHKEG